MRFTFVEHLRRALPLLLLCALLTPVTGPAPVRAAGPCDVPITNPVACENTKTGNPSSEWNLPNFGPGDTSIQGFASDISFNKGDTVNFKVTTPAAAYTLNIYRLGYYGGLGARKVASLQRTTAQSQPACLRDNTTGLIDCGNWGVSLSWTIPPDAVSGVYLGKLVRSDTGGANHMVFIVRDDSSTSPVLFQTSDTTWEAYNSYGGNSVYQGGPGTSPSRAYKVSYNRPFNNVFDSDPANWILYTEYPMLRFLEANGYNLSYFTGMDADRRGSLIRNHKLYLSVGHDEYWSGNQRANVEAARGAGVNLGFFSGNTGFWKTRWENSIDGTGTPYRTLVTYKETHANAVIDPADPPTWTGTWRDQRFSPPADGGRPENSLNGTIFMANGVREDALTVPAAYSKTRLWRNTSIASMLPGDVATFPAGTLGWEWDVDQDNGFRPAGMAHFSETTVTMQNEYLLDYGSTYGAGTLTHTLSLYKHPSGALVFSAGTIQWSWGLDANHAPSPYLGVQVTPDSRMQQATVNILADLGVQPSTLQAGLIAATASTDTIPPTSTISSPASGTQLQGATSSVTITGTAVDSGGGVVAGVEVSTDSGATWHAATGRENWSYVWTPGRLGTWTIKSRAVDDSGNVETPGPGISVTVSSATATFDDLPFPNRSLNGQYPTGEINWGTNVWWLSSPWGKFTTQSISYPVPGITSQTLTFVSPRRLISLQAFNGGTVASTVSIACSGQSTKSQSVAVNAVVTLITGWTSPCSPVSIGSSNGSDTNFDNVAYDSGTPDTTPPAITAVQPTNVTSTGALITWTTANKASDSKVEYGTTTAYGQSVQNPTLVINHSVQLSSLSPSTLYHFRVDSQDGATPPNAAQSGDYTFTTLAPRTTPPVISNIQPSATSSTATIAWTTDEPADSQVKYGTTTNYTSTTPLDTTLVVNHSVALSGLTSSTIYHFQILTRDASGNLGTSSDQTFTTAAASPPVTVTFDDLPNPNQALDGQYPTGVIDWGTGVWWLSSAWGKFTTQSISFVNSGQTGGALTFLSTPRRVLKIDAYNGDTGGTTVTISCAGQPTVSVNLAANQLLTISTGWTGTCTTVTLTSTNGWWTNFDNLVYDSGP